MNKYEETKAFLGDLVKEIKADGYRCFLYDNEPRCWISIITPNNSWLMVQHDEFFGFSISYKYEPSRECGSGCQYKGEMFKITVEDLVGAEKYGKEFTCMTDGKVCRPKHYEDGLMALKNSYHYKRNGYKEV